MDVVELRKTCIALPSQWEGTLQDGRSFYMRYRHGTFSCGFGRSVDDAVRNSFEHREEVGHHLSGSMSTRDALRLAGLSWDGDPDELDREYEDSVFGAYA